MMGEVNEVHTHEAARAIVEGVFAQHGAGLEAMILKHVYDSAKPDGKIMVMVGKYESSTSIRYGLPDEAKDIREMAIAALEPPELWKETHRRSWM